MNNRLPRILAVDDSTTNLRLVEKVLSSENYECLTSTDGLAALELIEDEAPDLVLLDVKMPGLTGYEVCQKIRSNEETQLLPVIMLTALDEVSDKIKGIEAGADDFLCKPFNPNEILSRVKSLLRIKKIQDELEEKNNLLKTLFGRYMSEDIAAEIVANPEEHLSLGGNKREATILFGDLRGFTGISESIDSQDLIEIINVYLTHVYDAVVEFGGSLDKIRGDGIMAIFGAPIAHKDDPLRAVRCALRIQKCLKEVSFPKFPNISLNIGIGINTGIVIAGNVGTERRMDYTVIGDEVNIAQRFEDNAGPGQILVTNNTYKGVKDMVQVRELGSIRLKGKSEGILAYDVLDCLS